MTRLDNQCHRHISASISLMIMACHPRCINIVPYALNSALCPTRGVGWTETVDTSEISLAVTIERMAAIGGSYQSSEASRERLSLPWKLSRDRPHRAGIGLGLQVWLSPELFEQRGAD